MTAAAIGVAFMLVGLSNQQPAVSNGATLLTFVGFFFIVAAVVRGGRRVQH